MKGKIKVQQQQQLIISGPSVEAIRHLYQAKYKPEGWEAPDDVIYSQDDSPGYELAIERRHTVSTIEYGAVTK